jgi:hypothetical protein
MVALNADFQEREGWYAAWRNHIGARVRRDVIVGPREDGGPDK